MARLSKNVRREAKYAQGGVSQILAFNTFQANGQKTLTVNRNETTGEISGITVAEGENPVLIESEIDSASYSDATQFGNNRYCKHLLNLKLSGRTPTLNTMAVAFDLSYTTHIVRTRQGQIVLLGEGGGLSSEKNESGSGAAAGDFNGYDYTLSGGENAKAPVVPESVYNTLLALTADND